MQKRVVAQSTKQMTSSKHEWRALDSEQSAFLARVINELDFGPQAAAAMPLQPDVKAEKQVFEDKQFYTSLVGTKPDDGHPLRYCMAPPPPPNKKEEEEDERGTSNYLLCYSQQPDTRDPDQHYYSKLVRKEDEEERK